MILRRCSTKGAFEAIPEKNINLNFDKIKSKYPIIADLPILILIKYNNYEVTCYKNGKLIIRKCDIKEEAEKVADEIYSVAK
ncbi:hypothetical protein HYU23_04125 [Candidatus Woesearchaeota archaeon]|nr:hypothetical protein [Candidatus Woesearchaeota archaeon]